MVQSTFSNNSQSQQAFTFTEEHKNRMKTVLAEALKLPEDMQDNLVKHFEKTGQIAGFGVGSLLNYSHLESELPKDGQKQWKPDLKNFPLLNHDRLFEIIPGKLENYRSDFVCKDIFYRGTKDNPGITLGIDEAPGSFAGGGSLVTNVKSYVSDDPEIATLFFEYYMKQFADREFPPDMPIYAFQLKDITNHDGTKTPALCCLADQNSHLYVGHLKETERAKIIGSAHGPDHNPATGVKKPVGGVTGLDYLRNVIQKRIDKDVIVEPHLMELYALSITQRQNLNADEIAHLESFEVDGIHAQNLEYKSETLEGTEYYGHINLDPNSRSELELRND